MITEKFSESCTNPGTFRNIFCAECHGDRDNLAKQKISLRCDSLDLADQCGLEQEDLMAESNYIPGHLR